MTEILSLFVNGARLVILWRYAFGLGGQYKFSAVLVWTVAICGVTMTHPYLHQEKLVMNEMTDIVIAIIDIALHAI